MKYSKTIPIEVETDERISLKEEAELLQKELDDKRNSVRDAELTDVTKSVKKVGHVSLANKRILRGHLSKVLTVKWLPETRDLISISPDGRILVWDTVSGMKRKSKQLPSLWSTCCAISNDGSLIAAGGLKNSCHVYPTRKPSQIMNYDGHAAYISDCVFTPSNDRILTSSGDNTVMLWDTLTAHSIHTFEGHESDVLNLKLSRNGKTLLTCSLDRTCRVWDLNTRKCVRVCRGHQGDINSVSFFPNEQMFASGSDDKTCMLYDLRSDQYISKYSKSNIKASVTSVGFSCSGRLLFAGYENSVCLVWDVLRPNTILQTLMHPNLVSCLAVHECGNALATGCWDNNVRIWN